MNTHDLHVALAHAEAAYETAYVALVAARRSGSRRVDRAFRAARADRDIARFALADAEQGPRTTREATLNRDILVMERWYE